MSLAGIVTVSCVLLTNVAGRSVTLKFTVAPATKFTPFTVSVKAGPPATTLDGLKDKIVGGGPYTIKVLDAELPPLETGLATITVTAPVVFRSLTGIEAVSCVALTKTVTVCCPPK